MFDRFQNLGPKCGIFFEIIWTVRDTARTVLGV